LAGVDGCPGGWIAATRDDQGQLTWRLLRSPELPALADVIAIDIPIGLPATGRRPLEAGVRRELGRRGSSVFPTPVRAVLAATTYEEACRLSRLACDGRAISLQTWHLMDKVREVDALGPLSHLIEAHPELSFQRMTGRVLAPKKTLQGRQERITVLTDILGVDVSALLGQRPGPARPDDALDALALIWTAGRFARGAHEAFDDGVDAHGRAMRIVV
jgi:predicted RNase H-like nuclease